MPDNRRNPNNQDNDDLSSTISGFSRSLDNLSQSLKDAADDFDETVRKLNRGIEGLSDDLDDHNDNNNQNVTDARDIFSAFTKNNNKNLNAFQTITKGFVNAIGSVFDYFIGQFKDSINRLESTFNDSLSDIAARMDLTYSQYQNLYTSTSDRLAQDNLNAQFSVTKYISKLQSVLETGLRGQVATDLAYSNLITGRLLPSLNTISTEYRRFYKMFGDQFSESITAIGRYTEEVYGAEHIEQGNLDAIIQSLQVPLTYAASTMGLSMEEQAEYVQDAMTRITSTAGILANTYNIDPTEFYQLIADAIANPAGSSQLRNSLGIGSSQLAQEVLTNENAFFAYLQNYLNTGYDYSTTPDYISQMTSILGRDQITALQIATAQNQRGGLSGLISDLRDDIREFDAAIVYRNEEEKLQNNQYISVQEKISNQIDNILDDLAVITAGIPNLWTFLGNITSAIGGVAGNFLGSFLGSKLGGGGTSSAGGLKRLGISGKGLIRGASAVTGALMIGSDAISGYQETGSAGQAIVSGITGETLGVSADDVLSGNYAEFSTGSMISNTVKGAAVGGAIVPGWGHLIGGAFGLVSNLGAQFSQMFDPMNEFAELVGKSNEALADFKTDISEVSTESDRLSSVQGAFTKIMNRTGKETGDELSDLTEAFNLLKQEYPDELAHTKEINDLNEGSIKILKAKIEYESRLNADQLADTIKGFTSDYVESAEGVDFDNPLLSLDDVALDLISQFEGVTRNLTPEEVESKFQEVWSSAQDYLKARNGEDYDYDDFYQEYGAILSDENNFESGEVLNAKYGDKYAFEKTGMLGNNAEEALEDREAALKAAEIARSNFEASVKSAISQLLDLYSDFVGSGENPESTFYRNLKVNVEALKSQFDAIHSVDPFIKFSDYDRVSGDITLSEIFKSVDVEPPSYKVGLYNVPSDNYLANLHSGEMVLTSTNADKLRQLASGGITGVLDTLTSLTATTSTEDSSAVNPTHDLIDAIDNQTATLVSELDTIYDLLYRYFSSSRSSRSSVSTIPENVVSMSGY
jgi:uncharacterized protein YukE